MRRPPKSSAATRVAGVRFKDGSEIPADLVVMTAGVRPNIALAQAAGLHCERAIVVDDTPADLRSARVRRGRMRAAPQRHLRPGGADLGAGPRVRRPPGRRTATAATCSRPPPTKLKVTGRRPVFGRRLHRRRGQRRPGAARSAPRRLQAPGAEGQPRRRRRAVWRRAGRPLVFRPDPEPHRHQQLRAHLLFGEALCAQAA